jgi:hypothetical protein
MESWSAGLSLRQRMACVMAGGGLVCVLNEVGELIPRVAKSVRGVAFEQLFAGVCGCELSMDGEIEQR